MKRILVVGAGGHAKVVIEALRASNSFQVVGVVDPRQTREVLDVPWLGNDEALPSLLARGIDHAVIALGDNHLRQKAGERLIEIGYRLPPIVHPTANVSPSAQVNEGVVIMAHACIGPLAILGALCVVNTAAIVEHDNKIGPAAHIAPGVALGGTVRVGERTLVGIGSSVRPGVSLGRNVIIGAGSAVVSDFTDDVVAAGVPARLLRKTGGSHA